MVFLQIYLVILSVFYLYSMITGIAKAMVTVQNAEPWMGAVVAVVVTAFISPLYYMAYMYAFKG